MTKVRRKWMDRDSSPDKWWRLAGKRLDQIITHPAMTKKNFGNGCIRKRQNQRCLNGWNKIVTHPTMPKNFSEMDAPGNDKSNDYNASKDGIRLLHIRQWQKFYGNGCTRKWQIQRCLKGWNKIVTHPAMTESSRKWVYPEVRNSSMP